MLNLLAHNSLARSRGNAVDVKTRVVQDLVLEQMPDQSNDLHPSIDHLRKHVAHVLAPLLEDFARTSIVLDKFAECWAG